MKLFNSLKRLFSKMPQTPAPNGTTLQPSDSGLVEKVFGMLAMTQDEELTCDEVFAMLDQFAEMASRGEDIARLLPLVKQHIDICGDCREEYQSLLKVLESPG